MSKILFVIVFILALFLLGSEDETRKCAEANNGLDYETCFLLLNN